MSITLEPRPPGAAATPTTANPPRTIIDWHTHWTSPGQIEFLSKRATVPRVTFNEKNEPLLHRAPDATAEAEKPGKISPISSSDIERRIRTLEQYGILRQVLSYALPSGYDASLSAEDARPFFRAYNDELAALVRSYPDHFLGLAALPTSDIAWAAQELDRAHRELGLIGGSLPLNAFSSLAGARTLAPIFAVAQKHRSFLQIHRGAAHPSVPGQPAVVIPEDTGYARWRLINDSHIANGAITLGLTDFLDPYPDVAIQLIMLGGVIPYVVEHIEQSGRKEGQVGAVEKLRRLWFDTGPYVQSPRSVKLTVEVFGADRVIFGSDYGPGFDIGLGLKNLDGVLTADEKRHVYVDNGRKILAERGIALPQSA